MRTSKRKKKIGYQGGLKSSHEVYYVPLKRKSRAGMVYEYYKKIIDKIGLNKNDKLGEQNIINQGKS